MPAIDRDCTCSDPTTPIHSGQPECSSCWTIRKLDRPAASHWTKAVTQMLCNVDAYDRMTFFPEAGISTDDMRTMLSSLDKLLTYSDRIMHKIPVDQLSDDDQRARYRSYLEKD